MSGSGYCMSNKHCSFRIDKINPTMFSLTLVKTAKAMQSTSSNTDVSISSSNETDMSLVDFLCRANEGDDSGMNNHGTRVLTELVQPIANTGRVIVANSYFASVQAALTLYSMGLQFIGTVKTATRGFPMHYFQRCLLPGGRGITRHFSLRMKTLGALCWPLYGLIKIAGISFLHVSPPLLARRSTADNGDKLIRLQMQTLKLLILLLAEPNVGKCTMKDVALLINTIDINKMDWTWRRKSRQCNGTIVPPILSLVCALLMPTIWHMVAKEESITMAAFRSLLKTSLQASSTTSTINVSSGSTETKPSNKKWQLVEQQESQSHCLKH
jgi:Transposase IS4